MGLPEIRSVNSAPKKCYLTLVATCGGQGGGFFVEFSCYTSMLPYLDSNAVQRQCQAFFSGLFLVACHWEWTSTLVAGWLGNELKQA